MSAGRDINGIAVDQVLTPLGTVYLKGYEMERLEICDPTATKEEAVDYEEEGFKVYTDYVEQIEVTNNIGEEN